MTKSVTNRNRNPHFVVDDHDRVMTLSRQRLTDMFDGRRGEPEWAGKTIQHLPSVVTVENRRRQVHDAGLRSRSTRKVTTGRR